MTMDKSKPNPPIQALTVQPKAGDVLDPEMPTQELRLHMGELTANEVRVARAAIGWANTKLASHGYIVPDGFVAVPRDPTEKMVSKGAMAFINKRILNTDKAARVWRAMIEAATKEE